MWGTSKKTQELRGELWYNGQNLVNKAISELAWKKNDRHT